jgi:predicted CoA-binding protein
MEVRKYIFINNTNLFSVRIFFAHDYHFPLKTKDLKMSESKKTLVIGASENPERYSYLAVQKLKKQGHQVVALGRKSGKISDTSIITEFPTEQNIDTVTLYINPELQKQYINDILLLHPKRLIFNPGTENDELYATAKANGIEPLEACTLVLLSTGQY